MNAKDETRIRLELVRGHWQLGERSEAIACLERAAAIGAEAEALLPLVAAGIEELEGSGDDDGLRRLHALRERLTPARPEPEPPAAVPAPLATLTLARLLAEQGHREKALAIADELLRRNPDDEGAQEIRARLRPTAAPPAAGGPTGQTRRIAELSRWLANLSRRKQEKPGGAFA